MVHQVARTDGTTTTQAADPNAMRRPASYTVTNSTGTPLWQSGTHAYDGCGNVTAIGGRTSTYDAVSRLLSAPPSPACSPAAPTSAMAPPFQAVIAPELS